MDNESEDNIPVIAIDGGAGSGKGLLALRLALKTGFHLLDSGALYRLIALMVRRRGMNVENLELKGVAEIIRSMKVEFRVDTGAARTWCDDEDVEDRIRNERVARDASVVAPNPEVRRLLISKQREFARWPGLVADGRDMGSRVFPRAQVKFFLVADVEVAVERRWLQLKKMGIDQNRDELLKQLQARDARDRTRDNSPLVAADDSRIIDTTAMSADEVFEYACRVLLSRNLI